METYPKIQTLFKRDLDGALTGKKGKMLFGNWTTPELGYLAPLKWNYREKVDGTNIRVGFDPYLHPYDQVRFAGRTDNAVIPKPLLEYLQATFKEYPYDVFGADTPPRVTLFGEGYGPKIQGGGKYREDHSFVLFDVKIGDFWLSNENVADVANKLGIESVPLLGSGNLLQAINYVRYGTPYLAEEIRRIEAQYDYNGWLENKFMKSQWGDFEAEGIVATPAVDLFNRKGERIITKIKAVDFR